MNLSWAPATGNFPHLLLSQLSSPFVEINIGLPQYNMGITSADTLREEMRVSNKFTRKTPASIAQRRTLTLMAVMANAIFLLPSIFVLRTRRMCWNFSGMTRDWKKASNKRYESNSPSTSQDESPATVSTTTIYQPDSITCLHSNPANKRCEDT